MGRTAGHTWTTQVAGITQSYAVLLDDIPSFLVPSFGSSKIRHANPVPVGEFAAQLLLWNPPVFPTNPEQYSHGLDVTMWSDGRVTVQQYGTNDGLHITMEVYRAPDGKRYVRFPFTIDGFPR